MIKVSSAGYLAEERRQQQSEALSYSATFVVPGDRDCLMRVNGCGESNFAA